jgi:hypothetical protein
MPPEGQIANQLLWIDQVCAIQAIDPASERVLRHEPDGIGRLKALREPPPQESSRAHPRILASTGPAVHSALRKQHQPSQAELG